MGVTRPQDGVSGFIRQEERNHCLPPEDPESRQLPYCWKEASTGLGLQPAELCEGNSYCLSPTACGLSLSAALPVAHRPQ